MRISWRELAVDLSDQSADDLMREWRWLVPAALSLRMVSALGDAFLEDAAGAIYWLDTGGAELTRIADSRQKFDDLRQEPAIAHQWFAPWLVGDLLSAGHSLGPGQCFSYKIPLTLGGDFQPGNFKACDLEDHFNGLGKIQSQVRDLPMGAPISSVALDD